MGLPYDTQLSRGQTYQRRVAVAFRRKLGWSLAYTTTEAEQIAIGESVQGVEVKYDSKCRSRTPPALWIEFAEKRDPASASYVPSGVCREDNTWLVAIGDKGGFWVFSKRMLQILMEKYEPQESPTSRFFLLPLRHAERYAALYVSLKGGGDAAVS